MIIQFKDYINENLIPNKDYFPNKTSVKQISYGLKYLINNNILKRGDINLDYGGGKYNLGTEYLRENGIINLVYDIYSRTEEHNQKILDFLKNIKVDSVTILNVLNTIPHINERIHVIKDAYSYLKVGGYMLISAYCHKSANYGLSKMKTWQENRKLSTYFSEIQEAIPNINYQIIKTPNNLILIQKIENTNENIRTKRGSLIKRFGDVGKKMGDDLYFHKDYVLEYIDIDIYKKYKSLLPKDFNFNIIKYNEKYKTISFIDSPDFDKSDEPIVGDSYKITMDGKIIFTKKKTIPQIYHHKWLFVKDDYKRFNVEESKERSKKWLEYSDKINMSKIGYQNYWVDEVLPLMK